MEQIHLRIHHHLSRPLPIQTHGLVGARSSLSQFVGILRRDLSQMLIHSQAFFTTILKDLGVRDLRVHEVFGVDDDALAILAKPVHAVIFLFKYQEDETAEQVQEKTCPSHVWFANQVSCYLQCISCPSNAPDSSICLWNCGSAQHCQQHSQTRTRSTPGVFQGLHAIIRSYNQRLRNRQL